MSIMNPHRLSIQDVITYLDSVALKEEIKTLTQSGENDCYTREHQQKKNADSSVATSYRQTRGSIEGTNSILSMLQELPDF